jgi:hypothetical protein
VTEGALIFRIVPLGTGSESKVSRRVIRWIGSDLGSTSVLHDSAAVGPTRNPGLCRSQDQDGTGQNGVQESYIDGIQWVEVPELLGL